MDERNFLFHGARLKKQGGVRRLRDEHDWTKPEDHVSQRCAGLVESAESLASRSPTKQTVED
ncbi:hypothetical protein LPAF129_18050 [Ligilactobacillus pabuli]|uniref:Uncharacterized protein n=1 Tax=Ligilactobacillus pabuli TaxID=2886039 RepID=A0ABQ5JJ22_9LACO|nr:hypothetical protein LPAF129_18050 [Ligilactobacillus pabuli]